MSLMLVHGELETTSRVSVCFNLLINGGSVAMEPILWSFCFSGCVDQTYAG